MVDFPHKLKQSWDTLDFRGFIISSLSLQVFLILFAPLRKKTSSKWIILPLWLAYFLADWVATISLSRILNDVWSPNCLSGKQGHGEPELHAFWGMLLLVHLGGLDTITAFALEGNEFWLRHLFGLVMQSFVMVYVFVRSLPHNQLRIPTILMFMNGTIKYAERIGALYLASAGRFKRSMNTKLVTELQMTREPAKRNLTELEVVQYAKCFFNTFKGLVVDLVFKPPTWSQSRDFFQNLTAVDFLQSYHLFSFNFKLENEV